jgi:hypothetical protein
LHETLWPELESKLKRFTSFYNHPRHKFPADPAEELRRIRQALISSWVTVSTSFYRTMIRGEGEIIRNQISRELDVKPDSVTFELEAALVVNTVACAILNPSKYFNVLYF